MSHRTPSLPRAAALAAALAVAGTGAQAQSSVTISGTLDVGVRQVRNGNLGSVSSEVSGSNLTSKLIIRGTEDLGDGWRAGFLLDSTILGDTGSANTTFWDRQSTVSLSHVRMGELRLGRDWAPTHLLWTGIDPFTTLGVASANTFRSVFAARVLNQAFGATADAAAQNPTLRVNNAIEYFLPSGLGGAYGALMVSAGEGGNAAAGATRGEGGRIGWANQAINVAYARYKTHNANGGDSFTDEAWGGTYSFGPVRASIGQRRWSYRTDRLTNTLLAAAIPVGLGVIRLSAVRADQSGATATLNGNDATLLGVGYVHSLSKRTALYGHLAEVANKGGAAFTVPGGPATSGVATAANYFGGQTSRGFELGIRHNF